MTWQGTLSRFCHAVPSATICLALLVDVLCSLSILPGLFFCTLFFWAAYRPQHVLLSVLFLSSLCFDSWRGFPEGATFLQAVVLFGLVFLQKRFLVRSSFIWLWFLFTGYWWMWNGIMLILQTIQSGQGLELTGGWIISCVLSSCIHGLLLWILFWVQSLT